MNLFETLKDLLLRFLSIDKSLTDLEETAKNLTQNNAALRDKLQEVADRVLALEKETAKTSDLQSLETRLTKLETEQAANLREIRAATAELTAERKSMAADFERYIGRIQNSPQLPPTTDN